MRFFVVCALVETENPFYGGENMQNVQGPRQRQSSNTKLDKQHNESSLGLISHLYYMKLRKRELVSL